MVRNSVNLKGFTLIEMLIVLVIMSLLLTVVPPLLSNALPSLTIKAAANDLVHDLKYIRNIAILKGRKTQITINVTAGSYSSEDRNQGDEQILPSDITVGTNHVTLHEVDDRNAVIAFFNDGSSSGGVITLKEKKLAYSIVIDWMTGSIALKEGLIGERF